MSKKSPSLESLVKQHAAAIEEQEAALSRLEDSRASLLGYLSAYGERAVKMGFASVLTAGNTTVLVEPDRMNPENFDLRIFIDGEEIT